MFNWPVSAIQQKVSINKSFIHSKIVGQMSRRGRVYRSIPDLWFATTWPKIANKITRNPIGGSLYLDIFVNTSYFKYKYSVLLLCI